ncbi:hypothetical protein ASH01_18030 [Terrabacter sp. Soil811]|uniref:hypothetical protein n=1 Tax=Terrabacter sp. Soil811 TaxID=1736419 RepID=UPI0006FAB239|nr:hypothetical protein [Terrabacter sp. Soil811]KRF41973.1 hypothetical protein ASH01_18030 [Terrabacter sp. Soil811]
MTERPYETTVPDDLAGGATSPSATAGTHSAGATSASVGSNGGNTSVKSEAKSVASDAADSSRRVADTAAAGAKDVASEAATQLRQLLTQLRGELDDQASTQGQRAVSGLRSLADELREMASSSSQQGVAGEAAGQAADRATSAADWLENRQPGDMLDELRSLARRRPGAFLLGAAVLGVVGGRLTRGLTAESGGGSGVSSATAPTRSGTTPVASGMPRSAAIPPSESPVRSEPYTVGVRDSDTHALTSMTGGVTSDPPEESYTEGRGGVR